MLPLCELEKDTLNKNTLFILWEIVIIYRFCWHKSHYFYMLESFHDDIKVYVVFNTNALLQIFFLYSTFTFFEGLEKILKVRSLE